MSNYEAIKGMSEKELAEFLKLNFYSQGQIDAVNSIKDGCPILAWLKSKILEY